MRLRHILFAGCAGVLGCNPSDFNSILDKAQVQQLDTPGASTGSLVVLPLPVPTEAGATAAARLLVARTDSNYLAVADYDKDGKATLTVASDSESANLGGSPIRSAAIGLNGAIILGTPEYGGSATPPGRVSLLTLAPGGGGGMAFGIQNVAQGGGNFSRLGIAVAAGNVDGTGLGNYVVLGDSTVQVTAADGLTPVAVPGSSCPIVTTTKVGDFYGYRAVAVGNFLTAVGDEIALGGAVNGIGAVVIASYDKTGTLQCPKTLTLGTSTNFGRSLAAADFDGDGNLDLAVGAPNDRVLVYLGPLDAVTEPSITLTSAQTVGFGTMVAAYHMAGQATAQLLVSDPNAANANGTTGAIYLFGSISRAIPALSTASASAVLYNPDDEAVAGNLGLNMGGLMFNTALCTAGGGPTLLPWASAGASILTFFNYAGAADPRCNAQSQ
jgi:hypothetical protein